MPFPALKDIREYYTDFCGGSAAIASEPLASTVSGTAAALTLNASVPPNFGIANLATGTTATGSSTLSLDPGLFRIDAGPHRFKVVFQIPVLASVGVQDFTVVLGFDDTGVDRAAFTIDVNNNLKLDWKANSVGGTVTVANTAIIPLVAATWYQAIIDIGNVSVLSNQAASPNLGGPIVGARFYFGPAPTASGIGQTAVAPKYLGSVPVSALPSGSGRETGLVCSITSVTGTTSKSLLVDKVYVSTPSWATV